MACKRATGMTCPLKIVQSRVERHDRKEESVDGTSSAVEAAAAVLLEGRSWKEGMTRASLSVVHHAVSS